DKLRRVSYGLRSSSSPLKPSPAGRGDSNPACTYLWSPTMTHALTHFLNPQSVAIIGVSPNPSFINAILNNLLRWQYDRPIYPVNPNYRDIAGLQTYPRISDVPDAVDLAVVSVPSRMMPDILQQCEAKGVRALNILTSGFEEIAGVEGGRRRRLLADFVQRTGIRI